MEDVTDSRVSLVEDVTDSRASLVGDVTDSIGRQVDDVTYIERHGEGAVTQFIVDGGKFHGEAGCMM